MSEWRRPGLSGDAGRVVGFLAVVAVVSAAGLLLATAPDHVQPTSVGAPPATAPAVGLAPDDPLPLYDDLSGSAPDAVGPGWTDVVGLVLKLGLVLALLVLALRGLQRLSGRAVGRSGRARTLELLETLPINQAVSLFLVGVGQRVFLLGGTTQHVRLLAEIDDAAVLQRLRPARGGTSEFSALLDEARTAAFPPSRQRSGE